VRLAYARLALNGIIRSESLAVAVPHVLTEAAGSTRPLESFRTSMGRGACGRDYFC
jgi:hypothetical protein